MTSEYRHIPVLKSECLELFQLPEGSIFVDCTLGFGGHSAALAPQLGRSSILVGIDQDQEALASAKQKLESLPIDERPTLALLSGNFGNLDQLLVDLEIPGVDGVLFDLGVSSMQLDKNARGFSFKGDGPLDMRMDPGNQTLTAAEIINTTNEPDLARIIRDFADEKWASRIAHFIVERRQIAPFETTFQLVDTIKAAIPASARRAGGHPAKRTFQALRIAVNRELDVLEEGLEAAIRWLNPGGIVAAISYHSLEDRIVKNTFNRLVDRCTCPPELPQCLCGKKPILRILTKKPLVPTAEEIEENPRSRSAKLRAARKL